MPEQQHAPVLQASPLSRAALLAYLVLILYASWYPFSGWRDLGLAPLAYLSAPLPHYWTWFDVTVNVVGYVPFGTLAVFALYPLLRGTLAVLLASIGGVLLAGTMEAVQTFLPSRIPSNLDLITNAGGACLGALVGALLCGPLLQRGRLLTLRQRWFVSDASRGLMLLGLWPLAQIYPQGYLFGHGQFLPLLSEWLSTWLATPLNLGDMLRQGMELTPEQYWQSETLITACGLTGALLLLLYLLRVNAPKGRLGLAFFVAALVTKSLASALLFGPDNALVWLTPGAKGGILIGILLLSGLAFAPPLAQRRLAIVMLVMGLVGVNLVPANPYFIATLQTWVQGKFLNFNGAAEFLSLAWSIFALWYLVEREQRPKQA
jgi:VanZ family protein